MSSVLCNPDCPTGNFTPYSVSCTTDDYLRSGGFARILLLNCESNITSLTSTTEWEALINAHDLFVSPSGLGKLNDPEFTKQKVELCRPDVVTKKVLALEWETFYMDNTDYTDNTLLEELETKQGNKTLMLLRCDGVLLINSTWTAGSNPGYGGFSLEVKRKSEDPNSESIMITGQVDVGTSGDWKYVPLPQAVINDLLTAPSP
jgi:hypothetical protein